MAGTVVVQTTASGAGAPVAVETLGTFGAAQLVKLLAGQASATAPLEGTTAAPDSAAMGLVVRPVGSVGVSGAVGVSGTVSVSGPVTVIGTISVSGVTAWTSASTAFFSAPALPVVLNEGAIVTANVANTVNVLASGSVGIVGVSDTTSPTPAATAGGLVVAIKPGASVTAGVSGTVSVLGNLTAVSTVGTVLGTVAVNVVA